MSEEASEDEYFSKQNCKLQGPPCKQCERFLSTFEDLERVFNPYLINDDLPEKYLEQKMSDKHYEDQGYALVYLNWIATILKPLGD